VTSRTPRERTACQHLSPKTLASAVLLALASLSAAPVDAAGLGRLSVQSALGQPLRAEVEVTSLTRDEAQSLSARLAPADAFRQAGLEFNPALSNLRFVIEPRNGRTFVRISSAQPINEPFVDLLLELNWATGKFVREYTFLLDPPELRTARESVEGASPRGEAAVAAPAPASSVPAPVPVAAAPAVSAPAPAPASAPVQVTQAPVAPPAAAAPAPAPVERPAAAAVAQAAPRAERTRAAAAPLPGSVEVRRGDTLGNVARSLRTDGVSLDQAMIAIYRANPSAFINNNINLLREGATLTIPDRSAIAAIDAGEATREVRMHSRDFNAYRQRLAGAPRSVDTPRSGQTAAGAIGGNVADRSGATQGGDQLLLSKPGAPGAAGGASTQAGRGAGAEQTVAREAALREARSRITDLEKNVTDLQKLLELKNKALADVQKQLDDARAAGKTVTGQVGAPPAARLEPPKAEAPRIEPPKAEAPPAPAPEAPKAEAPPQAPSPAAAAAPLAPVAEAPGFVDELLENPFLLPGLGGLALLGAGYGWYAMRRRRKVEKFEDSLIAADAYASNSLFGSTGGQSVDTTNSVFAAGASTAGGDVHSTEVDPIAEADVYIAYGREAQAEEILKEALKRQPERQAIRAKLLEIYAGRKDAKAFEGLAREMFDQTGGENEEWPKVVTQGLSLDPTNPLYGGTPASGPSGAAMAGAAAAAAAAMVASSARQDLDFASMGSATATPAPAAGSDEIPSLDFDLNLDTRIDQAAGTDGAAIGDTVSGPVASEALSGVLAASLDQRFELPSLDLDERTSAPAAGPLDLDLPALESLTQGGSNDMAASLDLSPISLDLEPATVSSDGAEASAGGAGRWQEMATKLDLASAYEEIGDKEGARELLQEVIKGGDNGQQQKARAMLGKIG